MRLWSLHPSYLDSRGLVALWREGLLALAVLRGRTRGYRAHPQLDRFRAAPDPVLAVRRYLWYVYEEATARGYRFDGKKLGAEPRCPRLRVTRGQLAYELDHLRAKLRRRDPARYRDIRTLARPRPHPLFVAVRGDVEPWERT
ncbi:MAG TPA: pyrimidine dimer DNA glycosylase/endonuclease V [Spirochaetia bacterium]|nr:pyrimidine dimer DNA glycosylase/endonuclease V [Spirochaetia bacterium]